MTPDRFKLIFPEFDGEQNDRVQVLIDLADPQFDVARWGDLYEQGMANYVAHTLVLSGVRASQFNVSGPASALSSFQTSKTVGDVSVSRSDVMVQAQAKNPLLATAYGVEFARLRRLVGIGITAV